MRANNTMDPFFMFGASVAAILFLSAATRFFIERSVSYRTMLLLFFPGVVIHEIFHAIASILVGAKIHGIQFFSSRGGTVVHERSRIPLGQLLISFAPFFGGMAVLFFVGHKLFFIPSAEGGLQTISNFFSVFFDNIGSWKFWGALYVSYSVSATMLPSWQDVKNTTAGLIVLFFTGGFLFWVSPISVPFEFFEKANVMFAGYVLPILLLFTAVSLICFVFRKAMR
jgi:hypothetical protein